MTLEDLMAEPPGGRNFGRRRSTSSDSWVDLSGDEQLVYEDELSVFGGSRQGKLPDRQSIQHGTLAGYTKRRCRCDLCMAAKRDYMRDYMRRRRAG